MNINKISKKMNDVFELNVFFISDNFRFQKGFILMASFDIKYFPLCQEKIYFSVYTYYQDIL